MYKGPIMYSISTGYNTWMELPQQKVEAIWEFWQKRLDKSEVGDAINRAIDYVTGVDEEVLTAKVHDHFEALETHFLKYLDDMRKDQEEILCANKGTLPQMIARTLIATIQWMEREQGSKQNNRRNNNGKSNKGA